MLTRSGYLKERNQPMRIIAGRARGIRLKMVPGNHVRPTADRVKESLFSVIGPFFEGGKVLDLFAGTGALGLEALSRGADQAIFVDLSKASCATIHANAHLTKLQDQVSIIRRDARSVLKMFSKQKLKFDLIFVDPPYFNKLLEPILQEIDQNQLLSETGILIVEHTSRDVLPVTVGSLFCFRELHYGETKITLYHREDKKGG